jgi:nicotinate-nucleotide pyrophosphorylase (carboxylating)
MNDHITLIKLALLEDLGPNLRDATTELLFPVSDKIYSARIISKHPEVITICGIDLAKTLLAQLSDTYQVDSDYTDGQQLSPGQTLMTIRSDAHTLLKSERLILNFLRHLCAIATLTAKYVAQVAGTSLKILDTRKTTPGMRHLEKYAVQCGGGVNHRMGLYDAIMIKDTHVDLLGGMKNTLQRLPTFETQPLQVIVEVRTEAELSVVLECGKEKVNQVLLDNMPLDSLARCVAQCAEIFTTEASGNIRLHTIRPIAETGVDYASVGELTYQAGQVDLSMIGVK